MIERSIWRRLLRVSLALAVVFLALYAFALPALVARLLARELATAGLEGWSLRVRSVAWDGLELADLAYGIDGRLGAERVRLELDPLAPASARVEAVEVIGARWEIRWDEGELDLGLPDASRGLEKPLRIERLDLRASTLLVRAGERTWRVPFEGTLRRRPEGGLQGEIQLEVERVALRIEVILPELGEAGPVEIAVHPGRASEIPLRGSLADGALVRLAAELGNEAQAGWQLEAGARLQELDALVAGRRVSAHDVEVSVRASANGGGIPDTVAGRIALRTLALDGLEARDVELRLELAPERSTLRASASGTGWKLEELLASLEGDARRWSAAPHSIELSGRLLLEPLFWNELMGGLSAREPAQISLGARISLGPISSTSKVSALRIEDLQLDLEPLELALPEELPDVRAAATLRLRGELGPDRVELELLEETQVSLDLIGKGTVAPAGSVRLQPRRDGSGRPAGKLAFVPRAGTSSLGIALPTLELRAEGLSDPVGIEGLGLELPLAVELAGERIGLALAGTGRVHATTLVSSASDQTWRANGLELTVRGDAELGIVLGREAPIEARGAVSIEQLLPVDVESASLRLRLARALLSADFGSVPSPLALPALRTAIELERIHHAPSGIELGGLTLETALPLGARPPAADDGAAAGVLEIRSLTVAGAELPGPSGTLRRHDGRLVLDAVWNASPSLGLALDGILDLEAGRARLGLHARGGIRRGDAIELLISDSIGARIDTELELQGALVLGGGPARAELRVETHAGHVESRDGEHALDGLELSVILEGPDPLRSVGPSELSWSAGRSGELELGPGRARFALEDPAALLVLGIECVTGGGSRFWTQGFRLAPDDDELDVQLFCGDVNLAEWLELTTSGRAAGEGRLNGRVALRIRPRARPPVEVIEGHLAALGGGRIQLQDAELVREMLAQGMGELELAEGVDLSEMVRTRIVGCLKDFAYRSLALRLLPEEGDLTLQAVATGQGRLVPQELDWTVNFHGFGSLLNLLLDLDPEALGQQN